MDISGLWIPLITPFTEQNEVDLAALRVLAEQMLTEGADGLVALGTTGEPTSLDPAERDAVVAVCAEVATTRGGGLVVGAGTNDTRTTLARHEALADVPGVTASLTVVPSYVRPSESAVVAHLAHVAERSPVPMLAYNVPLRTGRGLGATALADLADTPNVVGLKQAVAGVDLDTVTLLADVAPGFAVLAGEDPFLLPMVLLGARGGITASAHVATHSFAALVADARAGRVGAARDRAVELLPMVTALLAEPNPAVIKAVLHAHGRIPTPAVRMPLAPASRDATRRAVTSAALADPRSILDDTTRTASGVIGV